MGFVLVSIGGGLLIGLVAVEALVRLALPVTDEPLYLAHPVLRRSLAPHQTGVFRRDTPDPIAARYSINAAGFNALEPYHTAKPAGTWRVAVLGDSFVEALQVPAHEALWAVAAQALARPSANSPQTTSQHRHGFGQVSSQVQVWGFGVSGWGTADQWAALHAVVAPYRPDMVVLVFTDNDVLDCADSGPARRPSGPLSAPEPALPWWLRTLRASAAARWLIYQRGGHRIVTASRARRLETLWQTDAADSPTTETIQAGWHVVEQSLAQMAAWCHRRGVPLVVLHAPPVVAFAEGLPTARAIGPAGPRRVAHTLMTLGRGLGVPVVDLTADLAATGGRGNYIAGDGHWNARGHAVAGRRLASVIAGARAAAEGLPPPWSGMANSDRGVGDGGRPPVE